jgi:phosphocarrier protein
MITQNVTITNSIGLHARPATYLIQKATSYRCRVKIAKDAQEVNAKSLLGVLSLGIAKGMTVTITTDGEDEAEAMEGIITLIKNGLDD